MSQPDTRVRSINENEVSAFAAAGRSAEGAARYGAFVADLLERSETQPEWCFVAERDTTIVGSLLYCSPPSDREEVMLMGLHLPWEARDWREIGVQLIAESTRAMRRQGVMRAKTMAPVSDDPDDIARRGLLIDAGFATWQEKEGFVATPETFTGRVPSDLTYRTLAEVGEAVFIDAIRDGTESTLDDSFVEDIAAYGGQEAAERYFAFMRDLHDEPAWWMVAYDSSGDVVGVLVPQRLSDEDATVNYVAVLPRARGRGHGRVLLAEATARLFDEGFPSVRGDIDVANAPMRRALEQCGYVLRRRFAVHAMKSLPA